MSKKADILRHVDNLKVIFPEMQDQHDPLRLFHRLRLLEKQAERHAEKLCSDEAYCNNRAKADKVEERLEKRLASLMGSERPWLNHDPRGYALKVDLREDEVLERDWGGYGIIAPDF